MIRLGYAGINTELPSAGRTFRLAGYSEQRMLEISRSNLLALERILRWNRDHDITLFRITSNLIPFGSSPVNSGSWKEVLKGDFERIGRLIRKSSMRVSMHPGHYTVLNTPNKSIYEDSLRDLAYHADIFSLMHLSYDCKIIIHGGGAYGDKAYAMSLLEQKIAELPSTIRNRLILENDERVFTAHDIYNACKASGTPGVFDVFHHQILPSFPEMTTRDIIRLYADTWHGERQKIHYSDQAAGKNRGAHSESIDTDSFARFYSAIRDMELDIMLEVKDKQASLLRLRSRFPQLR